MGLRKTDEDRRDAARMSRAMSRIEQSGISKYGDLRAWYVARGVIVPEPEDKA